MVKCVVHGVEFDSTWSPGELARVRTELQRKLDLEFVFDPAYPERTRPLRFSVSFRKPCKKCIHYTGVEPKRSHCLKRHHPRFYACGRHAYPSLGIEGTEGHERVCNEFEE